MIFIKFSIVWAKNLFFFIISWCDSYMHQGFENPCGNLCLVFANQSFFSVASARDLKIKWKFLPLLTLLAKICSCQWFSSIQLQNRNLEARDKSKSSFCNSCFPERMSNQPKEVKRSQKYWHLEIFLFKYSSISGILYFKENKIRRQINFELPLPKSSVKYKLQLAGVSCK